MEDRPSVPLIVVCPTESIEYLKQLFMDHDYFSFDSEKVRRMYFRYVISYVTVRKLGHNYL